MSSTAYLGKHKIIDAQCTRGSASIFQIFELLDKIFFSFSLVRIIAHQVLEVECPLTSQPVAVDSIEKVRSSTYLMVTNIRSLFGGDWSIVI